MKMKLLETLRKRLQPEALVDVETPSSRLSFSTYNTIIRPFGQARKYARSHDWQSFAICMRTSYAQLATMRS